MVHGLQNSINYMKYKILIASLTSFILEVLLLAILIIPVNTFYVNNIEKYNYDDLNQGIRIMVIAIILALLIAVWITHYIFFREIISVRIVYLIVSNVLLSVLTIYIITQI